MEMGEKVQDHDSLLEIDGHGELLAMDDCTPNSSAVFVFAHVPPHAHALSDTLKHLHAQHLEAQHNLSGRRRLGRGNSFFPADAALACSTGCKTAGVQSPAQPECGRRAVERAQGIHAPPCFANCVKKGSAGLLIVSTTPKQRVPRMFDAGISTHFTPYSGQPP